uniref:Uncharacterized protein n=1 Tax=Physcomitrium patens TaxID=3218 RepID=A0A2K1K6W3_PHYPA|nr:hypothetical protein PHYPA_011404 [Physcomitrium patens]
MSVRVFGIDGPRLQLALQLCLLSQALVPPSWCVYVCVGESLSVCWVYWYPHPLAKCR